MKSNDRKKIKPLVIVVGATVSFCVLVTLSMYILVKAPHYIELSIHPPNYNAANPMEDWNSTTYSIYQGMSRAYVWRRETVNLYNAGQGIVSWQAIVEYFDRKLAILGWTRSDMFVPCRVYLPEASFLPENGPDGYVSYYREGFHPSYDTEVNDFLCLAVWPTGQKNGNKTEGFNIVLISVQPSLLSKLVGRIP